MGTQQAKAVMTFDRFQKQNLVSLYFPSFADSTLLTFSDYTKTQKQLKHDTHFKLYSFILALLILYHTLSLYRILFFLKKRFFEFYILYYISLFCFVSYYHLQFALEICHLKLCVQHLFTIFKMSKKVKLLPQASPTKLSQVFILLSHCFVEEF